MQQGSTDRRRGRRVQLEAPLLIRPLRHDGAMPFKAQVIGNISLAGVYFEADAVDAYQVNDVVIASVSIPETQRRLFPFTRVAGRSRVVRVTPLPDLPAGNLKRTGVALEFSDDVTALTAIPARS